MTKNQKHLLKFISAILCSILVFLQFYNQKQRHDRLELIGESSNIVAHHIESKWGVDYAYYYFITSKGQKIEGAAKCGSNFNEYLFATAIYNPTNPTEFDFSFNFSNYDTVSSIVFYFFVCLPTTVLIAYGFLATIIEIYLKHKLNLKKTYTPPKNIKTSKRKINN